MFGFDMYAYWAKRTLIGKERAVCLKTKSFCTDPGVFGNGNTV